MLNATEATSPECSQNCRLNCKQCASAASFLQHRNITSLDIARELDLREGEIAFFGGSVTDGLGDDQSDMDIFVLTDADGFRRRAARFSSERRAQQDRLEFGIVYFRVGNTEFDAEIHLRKKYFEIFESFSGLDPRNRQSVEETFASIGKYSREEVNSMLHRLRTGAAISNSVEFQRFIDGFNDEKFLVWSIHVNLIEAIDYIKGTSRSLRGDDKLNALLKLRRGFDSIVDAAIYAGGESIDRWKWRLPKLRRISNPLLLEAYEEVHFRPDMSNVADWISDKQVLAFREIKRISEISGIDCQA